jgi:hypothetical protein
MNFCESEATTHVDLNARGTWLRRAHPQSAPPSDVDTTPGGVSESVVDEDESEEVVEEEAVELVVEVTLQMDELDEDFPSKGHHPSS